jgi:predicted phosphohydrolase
MAIWVIADLHLSFGVPNKQMDIFGSQWINYTKKIESHWKDCISSEDLVLIPGDFSWALHIEEVVPDFEWLHSLPGTKFLIRGNHDYWWSSLSKIKRILPSSCHLIQNNSLTWQETSIAGTRLWDIPGLNFSTIINFNQNKPLTEKDESQESLKIYQRELGRLEMSLKAMNPTSKKRIVMTHYPPIGFDLQETEVSKLLEKYRVDICVFGHLHNVKTDVPLFGEHRGVKYFLTACDYLEDFKPLKILL